MTSDFHRQKTLTGVPSDELPSHPLPSKIGPYKIETLLSKGGMSYLYLGLHPATSQPIAIKVLSPRYITYPEMSHQFLKEAEIIAMTHHPNIVKLYGQGKWEKGLYIAMEFIQGISLRQFIQQKSLSQKRAIEIILQVAYALCHLHTHGVIHRDLKPENILITESGEIKVIDFGIAQMAGDLADRTEVVKGKKVIGTPVYMSPEQKEDPMKASYPSDIYSLGIIAYELLLGHLSYGTIHLSLLSKALQPILEKALQKDSKERYQDIVDFITEISHYLKSFEEAKEETPAQMLDLMDETRQVLLPQKAPSWPQAEIGIGIHRSSFSHGLYLDFFPLPEDSLCLLIAEPMKRGMGSLFNASVFRGMVKMVIEQAVFTEKKGWQPTKIFNHLGKKIFEEGLHQTFGLSFLLLNPSKDLLSFISCGYSDLWHISDGSKHARVLSTPNPLLGAEPNPSFMQTTDNWNSGDTVILHSFTKRKPPTEKWFSSHLVLSPEILAQKLVQEETNPEALQKAGAVVSIHRIF